jgi:hypothetical protein
MYSVFLSLEFASWIPPLPAGIFPTRAESARIPLIARSLASRLPHPLAPSPCGEGLGRGLPFEGRRVALRDGITDTKGTTPC